MARVSNTAEETLSKSTDSASLARTQARSAEIEREIDKDPSRFRILTGDRPTGHRTWGTTSELSRTG